MSGTTSKTTAPATDAPAIDLTSIDFSALPKEVLEALTAKVSGEATARQQAADEAARKEQLDKLRAHVTAAKAGFATIETAIEAGDMAAAAKAIATIATASKALTGEAKNIGVKVRAGGSAGGSSRPGVHRDFVYDTLDSNAGVEYTPATMASLVEAHFGMVEGSKSHGAVLNNLEAAVELGKAVVVEDAKVKTFRAIGRPKVDVSTPASRAAAASDSPPATT